MAGKKLVKERSIPWCNRRQREKLNPSVTFANKALRSSLLYGYHVALEGEG
jgi:hypothetical protein